MDRVKYENLIRNSYNSVCVEKNIRNGRIEVLCKSLQCIDHITHDKMACFAVCLPWHTAKHHLCCVLVGAHGKP